MNSISDIKSWIGKYILKNKLKKTNRNKQTFGFDTAVSIDILFDASITKDFKIVKDFVDDLFKNNKKVKVIGYVNAKFIPEQLYLINNFDFFCKKDLTFFNIPKSENTKSFIESKADILIDLSLSDYFAINYLSALKKASFKISRFTNENSPYDLMIDIKQNNSIEFLITQIVHYLKIIKSKETIKDEQ